MNLNIRSLSFIILLTLTGCLGDKIELRNPNMLGASASSAVFTVNPPYSYDFGNVVVNGKSAPKEITIENTGSAAAKECTEPILSGPGKDMFSLTHDCQQQHDMEEKCTINVMATPTGSGSFYGKLGRYCNYGGDVEVDLYVSGTSANFGLNTLKIEGGSLYTTNTTLNVSFNTFGSVTELCLQESSNDSDCTFTTNITSPKNYLLQDTADGNKTLYLWVKDDKEVLGAGVQGSIILDTANPTNPVVPNPPANIANSDPIVFNYTSGVDDNFQYNNIKLCTSSGCSSGCSTPVTSTTDTVSMPAVVDGTYYVCVQTVDYAGQASPYVESSTTFDLDNTAPFILSFSLNSGAIFTNNTTVDAAYTFNETPGSICLLTNDSDVRNCVWNSSFNASSETQTIPASDGNHTVYLWARDISGNTSITASTDSIIVDSSFPTAPATVNDPTEYSQSASMAFTFTDGTDANLAYHLARACTSTNCTTGCVGDATGAGTPIVVGGMANNVSYYACVRSEDLIGNVSSFTRSTGTTTIDLVNPLNPTVDAPASFASTNSYNVTWSASNDTHHQHFNVRVCTNSDCFTGCLIDSTDSASPYNATGLSGGSSYYSCVQEQDLSGRLSSFISSASAITIDTTFPTDVTPDNPPTDSTSGAYSLSWIGGADANLRHYGVRVCTNSDCATGCSVDTTDSASPYAVTGLADNTYYSCVSAVDAAGNTNGYKASSSTILVDTIIPGDVTPDNPPASSTNGAYSLSWTGGADANFLHFGVRVCTNSDCSTGCTVDTTDSASPYAVTGLADNIYYSCVSAVDAVGNIKGYTPSNTTIDVDSIPPSMDTFSIQNNTGSTSDSNVMIAFTTSLSPYEVCIQNSSNINLCSWSTNLTSPKSHVLDVSSIGTKTVYGWLRDVAGNISTPDASDSITFDNSMRLVSNRGGQDISGDVGNDTLVGSIGTNNINGSAGNDIIYADSEVLDPNSFGKLFYWLDAGDQATVKKADDSYVSKWMNKGKAGYDNPVPPSSTRYPLYQNSTQNGRSTLYFNQDYFDAFFEPIGRNNYTWIAAAARTVAGKSYLTGSYYGSLAANVNMSFGYESNTEMRMGQYSNDLTITVPGYTSKNFLFMTTMLSSPERILYASNDYTKLATTDTLTPFQSLKTDTIGKGYGPAAEYWYGDLAELFFFAHDLSTDKVESIEDYLSMKWGIVNSQYADGADILTGGTGNNVFVWTNASASATDDPDSITDFSQGHDYIYLQGFENPLSYIGTNAFSGESLGEVRVSSGVNPSYLYIDKEGDGVEDIRIQLDRTHTFNADDIRYGYAHGTSSSDEIYGGFGDDALIGGFGGDTIRGGDGDDIIVGDNRKIDKDTFSGLAIWYDPSNLNSSGAVQSNASSVTSLKDLSGNGYDLAAGTAPTYHTNGTGYPYISFNGTSQYLTGSVSGLKFNEQSWFYAHTPTDVGTWQGIITMSNNGGEYDGEHVDGYAFITSGGSGLIWTSDAFGANAINGGFTAHNGSNLPTYSSTIFHIDGASNYSTFYNAGIQVATDDGSNVAGMNPHCLRMGTRTTCSTNTNYGGHHFYQHFHYKTALNRFEQRRIEELMAYKVDTSFDGYVDGPDILYGEGGADIFVYSNASASKSGVNNRDIIMDFSQGDGDKILLEGFPGLFDFMGSGTLAGGKRQVSFQNLVGGNCSAGNDPCTVVYIDVDKDNSAEIEVELAGTITLTRSDFVNGSLTEALDKALLWLDPARANASGDAPYANGCAAGDLTWYDLSGNGFNGTLESFATCGATSGWVGDGSVGSPYALAFDGANDRVNLGKVLKFQGENKFSVSMWVKDNNVAGFTAYLGSIIPCCNYEGWAFYSTGSNLQFQMQDVWSSNCVQATGTTAIDSNWHHVAFTYDGSRNASGISIYLDGTLLGQTNNFDNLVSGADSVWWDGDFYVGSRSHAQAFHNGLIGVSFVFGDILDQNQIQELCLNDELKYTASRYDICATPSY